MNGGGGFAAAATQALEAWRNARRSLVRRHAARSAVHAWRIASRRLFALEQLLAPAAAGKRDALQSLLDDAFHAAGKLRDAQLAIRQLDQLGKRFAAADRLRHDLHRHLDRRRRNTSDAVRDIHPRVVRRLVGDWLDAPEPRLALRASRRLTAASRQAMPASRMMDTAPSLHRYRVRLKALRYMGEFCVAAGLPGASTRPSAASLQRRLGVITDLQVLLRMIDRFGSSHRRWMATAAALRQHLWRRRARHLAALSRAAGD